MIELCWHRFRAFAALGVVILLAAELLIYGNLIARNADRWTIEDIGRRSICGRPEQ